MNFKEGEKFFHFKRLIKSKNLKMFDFISVHFREIRFLKIKETAGIFKGSNDRIHRC